MKRLIFIIAVIFTATFAYGQSAKRMEVLFSEGEKLYDQWNLHGAANKWEQALQISKNIGNREWESLLLNFLGKVYLNLGDYLKAISYYERSLEIDREIGYKEGIWDNLGNLGDVYSNLGDYPKAISYYEQTLEIDKKIGDKKRVVNNLTNLGDMYLKLGDNQEAISYYEQSLEIANEIGDKQVIGDNLSGLGVVYTNLGDYPKAISYYEQVLEIAREIEDKKGFARNLQNLGGVYWNYGDHTKAITYFEQSLEINREIGDKEGIADNLNSLGVVYGDFCDFPKAISYFEQSLEIDTKIEYKNGIGTSLGNLGIVYANIGDYRKAISYYEQALEIAKEIGDKKGIGSNFMNYGNVYKDLGDYPKAIFYFEQALEIAREIEDKMRIGDNLNNLGVVYMELGEYAEAMPYFSQCLEIEMEMDVPNEIVFASVANIALKIGEIELAEETFIRLDGPLRLGSLNLVKLNYQKAIEYFNKALKRDLQSRDAEFLFADYVGFGKAYEGLKAYGKARENYVNAVTLVEEQREVLGEAEKSKFFMAEVMGFKRIEPYEGMVRVLIDMDTPVEAFFYSENLKARVLAEAIARGQSALEHSLSANLAREEDSYIAQIRGLRKQMEALYRNKAMDTYYQREKELKTAKAKQGEFITRLRESYPEYASIHYPQPIKPTEVALKPNEVLIEFEVTDNATYVLMLKDGKLETRSVPISRQELQELVLQYRGFFEGITKTSQLLHYEPEVGKKLYDLLFGDLLESVAEGTTLIIVPDEFLGILPFEALVTELPAQEKIGEGEFGPFPLGVKYLADKYIINYAQSATSLTLLRTLKKGAGKGQQMLVIADPIFSANDSRSNTFAQAKMSEEKLSMMGAIVDWKQMGVSGVRVKDADQEVTEDVNVIFPRLEKTFALAQKLNIEFGNNAIVMSAEDANEKQIKTTDFSQYRYLTFATHGILDRTVPYILEPALVLNQINNPEGYDGFLTMTEVMGLKLNAEVAALTACETGLGRNVSGEGVMGMGRAFQYAGAQNVLVSLWSVAETSATELTAVFFRNIKAGHEPKEAIRLARNEIRRKGYEHPFYWASFILFGK